MTLIARANLTEYILSSLKYKGKFIAHIALYDCDLKLWQPSIVSVENHAHTLYIFPQLLHSPKVQIPASPAVTYFICFPPYAANLSVTAGPELLVTSWQKQMVIFFPFVQSTVYQSIVPSYWLRDDRRFWRKWWQAAVLKVS